MPLNVDRIATMRELINAVAYQIDQEIPSIWAEIQERSFTRVRQARAVLWKMPIILLELLVVLATSCKSLVFLLSVILRDWPGPNGPRSVTRSHNPVCPPLPHRLVTTLSAQFLGEAFATYTWLISRAQYASNYFTPNITHYQQCRRPKTLFIQCSGQHKSSKQQQCQSVALGRFARSHGDPSRPTHSLRGTKPHGVHSPDLAAFIREGGQHSA